MEEFQELRDKAKKNIHIADHMLTVTYPLVKDTKLLLAVLENLFLGYVNAMSSILFYDRTFKNIPPFQDSFEGKLSMFKDNCLSRYKLKSDLIIDIQDMRDTLKQHKKSPVEFVKDDKFVICSDTYSVKTLGISELLRYLDKAKLFIVEMDDIVRKNEGIFG